MLVNARYDQQQSDQILTSSDATDAVPFSWNNSGSARSVAFVQRRRRFSGKLLRDRGSACSSLDLSRVLAPLDSIVCEVTSCFEAQASRTI